MILRDAANLEAENDKKRADPDIWELVLMDPFVSHMEQHVQMCVSWSQTFTEDKRLNYRANLKYVKRQTYDRFAAVHVKPSEQLKNIHEKIRE